LSIISPLNLQYFFIVFFITGFFLPKICVIVQIGIYNTRLNPNSSYVLNNVDLYKTVTTTYEQHVMSNSPTENGLN